MKDLTKKILFIGMIVLGIYDFGVFVFKGEATTVSQVMTDYLRISLGGAVIFMILGHWAWAMVKTVVVRPDYTRLKNAWVNWRTFPNQPTFIHTLDAAIEELLNQDKNGEKK